MSEPAGGSTWAHRWRTFYDVLLGVVLVVALLIPAVQQASTGTLDGLRNAMLLLLLNVAALVMLSRFITRPERQAKPRPSRSSEQVLSPQQVATLLDERGAPLPMLGLILTDDDIAIRQGPEETSPLARLAWSDCAAVVFSQVVVRGGGSAFVYLQFVAVHEDRIRRVRGLKRSQGAAYLVGVSEAAGAMVWGVPEQLIHLPPLILRYVEQHHPDVRIVRPEVSSASDPRAERGDG